MTRRHARAAVLLLLLGAGLLLTWRLVAPPGSDTTGPPAPAARPREPAAPGGVRLTGRPQAAETSTAAASEGEADAAPAIEAHPVHVVDARGRAVAGARVRVRRRSFSPFSGGMVTEVETVAGDDGLAQVPARGAQAQLAIAAPGSVPPEGSLAFDVLVLPPPDRPDLAPLVAGWPPPEATLALPVGGAIAGRVVDRRGRGLRDLLVDVLVEQGGGAPPPQDRTDADGRFVLPHLAPGLQTVEVVAPGLRAQPTRYEVETGTMDAELVLEAGLALAVRIPDWDPERDAHRLLVTPAPRPAPTPRLASVDLLPGGRCTIHGLAPGEAYDLFLPAVRAGRVAHAASVPAEAAAVTLALERPRAVGGALVLPVGVRGTDVHGAAHVGATVVPGLFFRAEDGTWRWRIAGLPPGPVVVSALAGMPHDPVATGRLLLEAGEEAPLVLVSAR